MIGKPEELVRWLFKQDHEKQFKITEVRKKRSKNANNYCWELISKIADAIGSTKEEVYRDFIKNKGIYRIITIDKKSANTFIKVWNERGLGWLCEKSENKDSDYVDLIAYYGTSSYDTKQMAYFIDYVVQEAKNLDIETLTPNEIESLKNMWR